MSENTSLVSHQENGLALFYALISGKLQPGRLWQKPRYRVKYFFRSLIYSRATARLLSAIAADSVMRDMLALQDTLPSKIHRPYLYLSMPMLARSEAIISHYDFASRLALPTLRTALLSSTPLVLTEFIGKNGEHFVVKLVCTGRCEREGEVNMFIDCDNTCLAMLTFAVINQQQQRVLMIGGMQGAHRDIAHDVIRDATKACYGLFPKRLLLEAVQMFANATGVARIEAVSDRGHVFRSLRYRLSKKSLFHASYDEFWTSINAERISGDLFSLPLSFPRKPMEEIASKKRSEYRKRYALLDSMQESFRQHLI
ncbi:virulence protein [Izhakiella australiensis]|uniref:Virulence protein n=1 Tax=Izhakiella australiensis TaxID=1926881 RepID=A0A1S8YSP6_9GAMM|nr:VirK/YbjX family protein [Izhakiella australiensis]OON41673.1 virulence protein [Izhakiella australiensis]